MIATDMIALANKPHDKNPVDTRLLSAEDAGSSLLMQVALSAADRL